MPRDTDVIRNYFAKLKLDPEIADIYLALHAYGAQTVSELSRNARVERTRLYRLLETMAELHTVLSWGLAWEMFDVPSLTGTRLRSFYPYDLDRVEILASQTVTAVP